MAQDELVEHARDRRIEIQRRSHARAKDTMRGFDLGISLWGDSKLWSYRGVFRLFGAFVY